MYRTAPQGASAFLSGVYDFYRNMAIQTQIKLKKSSTTAAVPSTTGLEYGELAINYNDGLLYYKNSSNVIKVIASTAAVDGAVLTSGAQTIAGAKTFSSVTIFTEPVTAPTPTAVGHIATKAYVDNTAASVLASYSGGELTVINGGTYGG